MTVILVGGVVTALVICFVVMKTFATQPKKASKSEKSEILRQLLAQSEQESSASPNGLPGQSKKPIGNPGTRSGQSQRKSTAKSYARNQLQNKRENA
jgi:hypothetical protein